MEPQLQYGKINGVPTIKRSVIELAMKFQTFRARTQAPSHSNV